MYIYECEYINKLENMHSNLAVPRHASLTLYWEWISWSDSNFIPRSHGRKVFENVND